MSFLRRLFGKRDKPKASNPNAQASPTPPADQPSPSTEETWIPGHTRSPERPMYTHVPVGWPAPTISSTTNRLTIDALSTVAQYQGEHGPCEDDLQGLLVPKLLGDGGAIRIDLLLTHKETQRKHGVFFCYDEEQCGYFPYYAQQLALEPGYGETLYFGIKPYQEVMEVEQPPIPPAIAFTDLFNVPDEKDFELPDGTYALWQRLPEDPLMTVSPTTEAINRYYKAIDGYHHHLSSICFNSWHKIEEASLSPMPDESVNFPLIGPDREIITVQIGAERGLMLQTHSSSSATYRERLYTQFANFAEEVGKVFRDRSGKTGYDYGLSRPLDWWNSVYHAEENGNTVSVIAGYVVGDRASHHTAPLRDYEPDTFEDEQLVPRIALVSEPNEAPYNMQYMLPMAGQLYCAYGVDRGDHYTYVTLKMYNALSSERQASLHDVAMRNLIAQLPEGIQVQMNQEQTFGVLLVNEDLIAATLLHHTFWDGVSEAIGGDLAVAVPSRAHVAFAKFTSPEGIAELEKFCEFVDTQAEEHNRIRLFDHTFYRYDGPMQGWSVFER